MKKIFQCIVFTVSALILAACASYGRNFDMNALDSLTPGETTMQEAIAKLGKPTATHKQPNGDTVLGWSYATSNLISGAETKSASIIFSPDGKMKQKAQRTEGNSPGL